MIWRRRHRNSLSASLLALWLIAGAARVEAQFKRSQSPPAQSPAAREAPKVATNPAKMPQSPANSPGAAASASTTLESLKVPAGAIIVLCDQVQQALQLIPRAVVLAPDEYEQLLDQIEQLKRRLKPDKPESPSACRISGRVEGSVAYVFAKFEIKTRTARTFVNLGCQRAWPTAASLDGQLPWIQTGEEGYVVQIDQPGTHQATLDLVLP